MFKIAVLASGSGSNLQAIIDHLHGLVAGIQVAVVVSDVPGALALERAERADIPTAVYPLEAYVDRETRDQAMADAVEASGAELVVLAGYMRLVTPGFLERFPHQVINLHPALLPSFPGEHGIEDALEYGAKVTGVTVHFVDPGVDSGPVIRQETVSVHDDDTPASLGTRIHALEHRVLPRVIELFARGRITAPEQGSRRVRVDDDETSEIIW
ncbi:MAG: phosphoribosylglycinamide formyltransferase [Actinobacteria bacterium]|nr:phosphoribosylglycinamide formyltransferase [Actinomycetota bacterium]